MSCLIFCSVLMMTCSFLIGDVRASSSSSGRTGFVLDEEALDRIKGNVRTVLNNEHGSAAIDAIVTDIISVVTNPKSGETINKILTSILITMEDQNGHDSLIALMDSLTEFLTDKQLQKALKQILIGLEQLGTFEKTPILLNVVTKTMVTLKTIPNIENSLLATGTAIRQLIDREDSCVAIGKGFQNLTKVFNTSRFGMIKNNVKNLRHRSSS